jgi:hypothetical protein
MHFKSYLAYLLNFSLYLLYTYSTKWNYVKIIVPSLVFIFQIKEMSYIMCVFVHSDINYRLKFPCWFKVLYGV